MFTVDISPNPIQIGIGSGGSGGGGSPDTPRNFIKLIDHATNEVKYAYVYNGYLYISDEAPES